MNIALGPLVAVAAIVWLVLVGRIALVAARMFQIEEYESIRFLRWGLTREWLVHRSAWLGAAVALVAVVVSAVLPSARNIAIAVAWLASAAAAQLTWRWTAPKRELVITARMRRILIAVAVLEALIAAGVALVIVSQHPVAAAILVLIAAALVTGLTEMVLVVANIVTKPAESAVRRHYLGLAAAKIDQMDPMVVAVVGSYGKTSTKHILARLLQPSVDTLPTRKSFNTLMGVSRVINEDLLPRHRVFLVEMDAYTEGEITAISDLVHPRIGVITAVGPQHLERFGTLERIATTLYEVVAALPEDGTALIHTGDAPGAALARRAAAEGRRLVRYAIVDEGGRADADVVASNVRIDGRGARFLWSWPAPNLEMQVRIPLLGRHQVANVTAALAVVHLLGHSLGEAVAAAAALEPIEHRLELMPETGPLTVIDDSYNANPVGVHNGLEILDRMEGGAKLLVTPGMVELGSVEDEENYFYGAHAARVCDHVIVMSAKTTAALTAGLRSEGMSEDRIHVVESLEAATALLGQLSRPGDVVLFANDLPDTYLRPRRRESAPAVTSPSPGG